MNGTLDVLLHIASTIRIYPVVINQHGDPMNAYTSQTKGRGFLIGPHRPSIRPKT